MSARPRTVNYFLIIYLISYLCLSFFGDIVWNADLLTRIIQFLPLILGILYFILTRQPIGQAVRIQKFHPLTVPLVILFTYCLWPFVSLINMLSMLFSDNLISSTVTDTVASKGLLYALITIALFPAVVEEFTFRGVIYGQYRQQRPVKAIFLSALCFGLMHMNLNQFCYAFVLGIFLALLVEATGSLIPSILMHFTFNSTSILLVYIQQKLNTLIPTTEESQVTASEIWQTLPSFLPIVIVSCVFAFLLFRVIAKLNGKDREIRSWFDRSDYRLRPNCKLTNIWFYSFVVICVLICILIEFLV